MPQVNRITQKFIDQELKCPDGKRKIEYCDKSLPGFLVEVTNASPDVGSYRLRYKDSAGSTRYISLGRTNIVKLESVRMEIKKLKANISLGGNPSQEREAKKTMPIYSDFFINIYMPYVQPRKRTAYKDEAMFYNRLQKEFGHIKLDQLRRKHISTFHNSLKEQGLSGSTADHHLKLLRHSLNIAIQFELLDSNPAALVPQFNDFNQVDNRISQEELECLLSVLKASKSPISNIALMLIATACRVNEILTSTWSNCDLENRILYIPAENSKSKKMRSVPLNNSAMDILNSLDTKGKYDYIFINPRSNKRYVSVHKGWCKLRSLAGLPHLRMHDLRHFVASSLASQGESIYIISKLLGHANVVTSERYSRVSNAAIRKASDDVSDILNSAMKGLSLTD